MTQTRAPRMNRLADETSPYLLQHAANPVEWYPWGPEALDRARLENKPILLSIGYSACHWCHVMAHESFEDAATAAVMNEHFINIKVDREERPDLDKIYQLAHQMLIRHGGGWPLTMFLSPEDRRPFFGGTYFPKEPRHGLPSFTDLLQRVAEFYRTRGADIREQASALQQAFEQLLPPPASTALQLTDVPLESARAMLAKDFDAEYGGFGNAPKFPHPTNLVFLLRRWRASAGTEEPDLHSLYMTTLTLTRMAEGGIFDQVGGGFARYSVDRYWMIPHFEKMTYDNAQLLGIYAEAAAATGDPLFHRVADETATWLLREMRASQGAFYSALDADSEGHEGEFYVWDAADVRNRLPLETYDVFARRFGLDRAANFEGRWHLHAYRSLEEIGHDLGLSETEVQKHLDRARTILLEVRAARSRPGLDDKILTALNGLVVSGMATAARALQRSDLASTATQVIDFIREHLWANGRLLATHKEGQSRLQAYLDDYAFVLDGVLQSLQTCWRTQDLRFALELADVLLLHFEDREQGGFYFTADDHEPLIHRSKSFADEALPAGNAVAAWSLSRLGWLVGETRYLVAAERALRAIWPVLERYPHFHATSLIALDEHLNPPTIVVIRGDEGEIRAWQDELCKLYAPKRLTFAIPAGEADLPASLAAKTAQRETVAYVCHGPTCSEPITSIASLLAVTRG